MDRGGRGHDASASRPQRPAWPGLEGGDDFEDRFPRDEEAFNQEFGVQKSSGIDFSKYATIDVRVEDTEVRVDSEPKSSIVMCCSSLEVARKDAVRFSCVSRLANQSAPSRRSHGDLTSPIVAAARRLAACAAGASDNIRQHGAWQSTHA